MKQNSWHYKLALLGNDGFSIYSGKMSICQYARKVLQGALLVALGFLVFATALSMFTWWITRALYEIVGFAFGFAELTSIAGSFIATCALVLSVLAYIRVSIAMMNRRHELDNHENHSFISKLYKSYKSKVCFPVEFKE